VKWLSTLTLAAIALVMVAQKSSAQSSRACEAALESGRSADLLIRCVYELSFRLERSERSLRELELMVYSVREESESVLIPSGAVLAFDSPSGCPKGWRTYSQASGRTIVGVGRGNVDQRGQFLTIRELYTTGGQEYVTLNLEQMPSHSHPILRTDSRSGDGNFVNWASMGSPNNRSTGSGTVPVGGGKAHENMPPFIALHYCIKS